MSDEPRLSPELRQLADRNEAVAVCHDVLWLANNLHNYGTEQWRGYFMACVRDARRVGGYDADVSPPPASTDDILLEAARSGGSIQALLVRLASGRRHRRPPS